MSYHCIYKATYLKETRWGWEHDHTPGWYVTPDESITGYNGGWFKAHESVFLKNWCHEHLSHEWKITYRYLYIADKNDATLFNLTWA